MQEDTQKMPKTLQLEIMKRFLNKNQIELLFGQYKEARQKSTSSHDRATNLEKQITEEELAMLSSYLFDTDIPVQELSENIGFGNAPLFYNKVCRIALRYLRQNGGILDKRNS